MSAARPTLTARPRRITFGEQELVFRRPLPAISTLLEFMSHSPERAFSLDELTVALHGTGWQARDPERREKIRKLTSDTIARARALLREAFGWIGWLERVESAGRSTYRLLPPREAQRA